MKKDVRGAWVVHHSNKLQMLQTQDGFENLHASGRAGILLSAISASQQVSLPTSRVEALAKAAKIHIKFELPILLEKLQSSRLIDRTDAGIEVLGVTTLSTLGHTSDMFESEQPNSQEEAVIHLAELSSRQPVLESTIRTEIADTYHVSTADLKDFFEFVKSSGMVDYESAAKNDSLYFNGNLFRAEAIDKAYKIMQSLGQVERDAMQEVDGLLQDKACLPLEITRKILGKNLFEKLTAISFYDVNIVNNSDGDFAFITKPASFSKYQRPQEEDAFDNAKALVTSLTYGMTRSAFARGQITMIDKLLGALIQGRSVGPVRAIGEDYKALEQRGVIKVDRVVSKYGPSYSMRLLKTDVGELALKVIQSKDISDQSLKDFPEASVVSYSGPEKNRESIRKKQNEISKTSALQILDLLRSP